MFDAGANRLGALALRISDLMDATVRDPAERSPSAATALSAMLVFLDAPTIDQLSRVVGLTSSATVRVVDGLVAEGLAVRTAGADGRVSAVKLTAAGRRRAQQVVAARGDVLANALSVLDEQERAAFDAAVDKVLVGLIRATSAAGWMCRLCETGVCGAAGPGQPCPVTRAALG